MRLPNETISQFAIRVAWETGHFWSPENPEGAEVKQEDLIKLAPDDPVVVKAMISMSKMDASRYTKHVLNQHGRTPNFDGEIGPAIVAMVMEHKGRCPVPDFAPPPGTSFLYEDPDLQEVVERMQHDAVLPAFGSGNWKGCHDVGQFHCATVGVNTSGLPSFLKPVFLEVLKNVQRAYAGVGLLFRFVQNGKDMLTGEDFEANINTEMSFVNSSDGWIGLAIVGQGETCGSKIWCRFLNTYKGGSDNTSIITQWTTLIKHELGHNCGRGHTNGGVMNPSIVNNLPTEWGSSDPSTNWLKQQFGGVPVPIPGGNPTPPPTPPVTTEQLIRDMQVVNAVQTASIDWLISEVQRLKSKAFIILFALLFCGAANAQVASSDGQSIVISSNPPVATEVPALPQKPTSPDPMPFTDAEMRNYLGHPVPAPTPEKTCSCSPQCTCGCNQGKPCQCARPEAHTAQSAVITTERFLISEVWCGLCPAAKARFIASGGNPNNILTMAEAKRRHGIWHNPPFEYTASESTATSVRTMAGPGISLPEKQPEVMRVSPPVRFIQWPGWGQIDLETYNRNCNCSMCRSIRQMQQEYRRQLQLSQQPQAKAEVVTPDQEGTPHALVETMLDSMQLRSGDVLADLGCGDGRVLIAAARRGIRGLGVELDPERAAVARRNVANAGFVHLIQIETGDALEFDMSRVTAATTYLYPPLLAKLSPKLASLRVVASPYHSIPGLKMTQTGDVWVYRL